MKIGILTHPLGANYGGILQAWALSTYLEELGHEVVVLNRQNNLPLYKRVAKKILTICRYKRYVNPKYINLVNFVEEYINYSKPLSTNRQMTNYVRRHSLDLVIVGSDQVWRPDFAKKYGFNYFLDFVPQGVKKASYAASFGLSDWRYNFEDTEKIAELLSKFVAISVREDEAVKLCKDNLHIDVEHLIDPTLLLTRKHYDTLASYRKINEPYACIYWLGPEEEKQRILKECGEQKTIVEISLRGNTRLESIEDWLAYIKYADNVITDSFHGVVFSILFNKQFYLQPNSSGGNGRLRSLLNILEIKHQLDQDRAYIDMDYSIINRRIDELRKKSYKFISRL